jgi:hypothetical protein
MGEDFRFIPAEEAWREKGRMGGETCENAARGCLIVQQSTMRAWGRTKKNDGP